MCQLHVLIKPSFYVLAALKGCSIAIACSDLQDKINAFWEITKKDLDDKKAELRNKDREMEEMEERHQVEIKVYKQKVKHLLYEHQNNITTLKADGELALKLQQDEFRKREAELARDKRDLKIKLKEQVGGVEVRGLAAGLCQLMHAADS